MRRLSHCNEYNLYPGQCGLCGKRTLTQFPPQSGIPYYCRECWHSDKWDATTYGKDVDFGRPIFDQIRELQNKVPSLALDVQGDLVNCDYIHFAGSSKNCYLIMHADFCEDCLYGYGFKYDKSCMDGFYNLHSELCYDCVDVHKCYALIGCQECVNTSSSAFLRDCIGCKACFLCTGLRNKEYCFENQQLTKDEYLKRVTAIDLASRKTYQSCREKLRELESKHTFKEYQGHNLERCSGNHLYNCKDVQSSFDCENVEFGKYVYQVVNGAKDVYDVYQYGLNLQQSLECAICGEGSYHILYSFGCHMSSADLAYCWYMEHCTSCFGCVNMKQSSYCILNKQYTKEEYEKLVPKIIEHMKNPSTGSGDEWGELLPPQKSRFGYNKTSAQQYYPLDKATAVSRGWKWDEFAAPPPQVAKTIEGKQLPDSQKDIPDDVLNWAILCVRTGKPFKIQPLELKLLRQNDIPVPDHAPQERHLERFARRNPRKFWKRPCGKCKKEITTTWDPKREETVYCEACYQKEVY